MKKTIIFFMLASITIACFAQTKIDAKQIGKTLEKNKDATAVFTCDINLTGIKVSNDGTVTIPALGKSKVNIMSGMDMSNINERIEYKKVSSFTVTFETKSLKPQIYLITKIDNIESVAEYFVRIEIEEKERLEKERISNLTKIPVQVVNQESINLSSSESAWLPGQLQDKLKSNLQEYLGMKTVVDLNSEKALKKIQAESESSAHDESTAIELGKITTAKFAFFVKVRKTGTGYTVSGDFTDLTTGEQLASVTSKEYTKAEYLYGSTGATDEITLSLANKLGIPVSDLNKNLLTTGSSAFTTDEQLALAKQTEEQYQKMMSQYDNELAKLSMSNDLSAIENKRKIEAEKALLVEKQNAEIKRKEELRVQKEREQADSKLEVERSIALKTQRDQIAKDAAEKAAEVRKLKMEKQGVLGQINVIENKKRALLEIRQGVNTRIDELYAPLRKECDEEEQKIRNKSFSSVELENGKPTQAANRRRENLVWANYENYYKKFLSECEAIKNATSSQESALLAEIRTDQKDLATTRTVSSMGEELKVSYGTYSGQSFGWNAYLSLYSDGVLLYQDSFIVKYEAVTGKSPVNLESEADENLVKEYMDNVDMYNSLLSRGDPIIYFEINYIVEAEKDNNPSEYSFNFKNIRVINTVTKKNVQTSSLDKTIVRTMKPEYDLKVTYGTLAKCKEIYENNLLMHNRLKEFQAFGLSDNRITEIYELLPAEWINSMSDEVFKDLLEVSNSDKEILTIFGVGTQDLEKNHGIYDFLSFTKVKYFFIPNSVTSIGEYAFARWLSLTSILIPDSVTSFGFRAFYSCDSLEEINYTGSKEEWEKIKNNNELSLKVKINYNYKKK